MRYSFSTQQLSEPATLPFTSLLATSHLLLVEMVLGDSSTQQAHIRGIEVMIQKYGGVKKVLSVYGDRLALEVVRYLAAQVLFVCIFCEIKVRRLWAQTWAALGTSHYRIIQPSFPVSPLYSESNMQVLLDSPGVHPRNILPAQRCRGAD